MMIKYMHKTIGRIIAGFAAAALLISGAGCAGTGEEYSPGAPADDGSLDKVLSAGKLVLGLDASFPPMGFTDENNNIVGFDIDLAEEVCKRLGIELVKQPIDWENKEEELSLGRIDCIWNGLSVTAERRETMTLSKPYMKNDMIFIVKTDSPVKAASQLGGLKVGAQTASSAVDILKNNELFKNIELVELEDNVTLLDKLDLGFLDAVFLDSVVAYYFMAAGHKEYYVLPGSYDEGEYAIGFRKGDFALRDRIWELLAEMKEDGTLAAASARWFGSDITTVR